LPAGGGRGGGVGGGKPRGVDEGNLLVQETLMRGRKEGGADVVCTEIDGGGGVGVRE